MGSASTRVKDIGPQPQSFNIERATKENSNYRSVAWSGRYLQVTLMSIPTGGDIGLEPHPQTDQFLRLDAENGLVQMGAAKDKLTTAAATAEADDNDEPAAWSEQPEHVPDKHG
jgi:hypothetical protein